MSELRFLGISDLEGRHDLVRILADADLSKYDFLLYKGDSPDPQLWKKRGRARVLSGTGFRPEKNKFALTPPEELELLKKAFLKSVEDWAKKSILEGLEGFGEALTKLTEGLTAINDLFIILEAAKKGVEDAAEINNLFGEIKKQVPIYGVLGNSETIPTIVAPQMGLPPVDFSKNVIIVHNKVVEFKGFNLLGYNGRPQYIGENPENVRAPELYFDEGQAAKDLHKLFEKVDPRKTLFITHAPPYGILDKVKEDWVSYGIARYGEKAKDGHIGSDTFKSIVLKYQPFLHTFGHIHERAGVEKQGETTFFNGGSFGETELVEEVIIKDDEITCKWLKLSELCA